MSESLSKNCNSGNSTDFCDAGPGHLCGTTAGMSTSLFTKWFCTSGPEHLPGTTTGMSTSLTKKSRPEHLRDLHKFSELSGTRAPVVEHNGHDNLVQGQHLGDLHGKCTVCTVRTCCSRRENCRSLSLHEAATSATVEELQQRQFHSFYYCLDQLHVSSTATGMSTLVQELPLDQRTCRCIQRAKKLSKNCTCGIATEQREGHRHQQILRNCPPGTYRP